MARVLLVEDDRDVRTLLEHILLSGGHHVVAVERVKDARDLIQADGWDFVLVDGILADGTGMDIADAAKARGISALILTGNALQLPQQKLVKHDYLLKPIRAAELLEAIEVRLTKPAP